MELALLSQGRDCFVFLKGFLNDCLSLHGVNASGKCKHYVELSAC